MIDLLIDRVKSILKKNVHVHRATKFLWTRIDPKSRAEMIATRRDEDAYKSLLDRLLLDQEGIFFIQVGSNDGIVGDPLRKFILPLNWHGYLFEPVPQIFAKLESLYSAHDHLKTLNVAISPQRDDLTFYTVKENVQELVDERLPRWHTNLSSFNRANIAKHLNGILNPHIIEIPVKVMSLDDVLRQSPDKDLYLLHIDAEGYDFEVLSSLNLDACTPKVIILEHMHLPEDVLHRLIGDLRGRGYAIELFSRDLVAYQS